jgi:hypothetical protein
MQKLLKNERAIVFELLIAAAMAIVIFFALMNIGTYINGTISDSLSSSTTSTKIDNTLANISDGYDDNVDIMIVAALITVITVPLAAVVAIRKLM